ncbi:MAG: PD-(D/E)XK nuclease family protein [Candidatus Moranbacteria bacterium]|nr:PD-(D/E)XK nuclease family protein [Candidatus Moranbacteria bacterium]MDD3965096.1 PD-(D/E)XK nuclease family protein [Candidatus Moranbacteria bacterium]
MRISYSTLNNYQTCPLKYKFREIDKIKEPKSKEAVFGTLIHAVLKYIHTPAILSPTLDQALDYYSKGWNSEVYDDEMEERSAFTQGVAIIQKYLQNNKPNDYTIIDLESRFAIEIGNEQDGIHTVSGIIDRIDKTEDGYEIIDYKTTRKMPSQDKVDNDLQLSIYLRAFLERYPKEKEHLDKITVSLYFVKHGVKLSSKRTKEQLEHIEETFLDVIKSIEEEKFDPILSPLCDWCGYQNICPMWKHKFAETHTVKNEEAEKAISEYLDLKGKLSEEKLRLGKLQSLILQYMEQEGIDRVFDDNGIIAKSLRKTYKYDADQLRAILEPLDKWESVLKVDGVALRNILAVLPTPIKQSVEGAKVLDKESVSLSVKKNKIEVDDELSL